jgi:uncharacterized protein (TIGR00730 family)
MTSLQRVAVYCGSSTGFHQDYLDAARSVATELVRRDIELVYGGGNVGLMGVVADAVLELGGRVHGVITTALLDAEIGHRGLTTLDVLPTMQDRKARMADLADGFLALPGGFGTFEELFEVVTWTQLGIHQKPAVVLNVRGFFDPMLAQASRSKDEGFMRPIHAALLQCATTAGEAIEMLRQGVPEYQPKWVDRT